MFSELLEKFEKNITGLREFVDLINPMLDEYHNKEKEKHDDAFIPLALARQIEFAETEDEKKKLKELLSRAFDGEIKVEETDISLEELPEGVESSEEKKFTFIVDGDMSKIRDAFEFQAKSNEQKNLLYVNSLISLLSSAEWFYSQLLHFFYDKNPSAAGIKKKTLTLEELKSFGTVEDAEKYLIDSKIETLLRSSFSDWVDTLREELKLGLGYLKGFQNELIEIYQRRNLFVHNGGVVNSIYLAKVETPQFEINEKLEVDEEYLENAIDKIHVLFSLIACELWTKDNPSDEERADFLMHLSYSYLKANKWVVAEMPNIFLSNDGKQQTIPRSYAQLNCWLCKKRVGDQEALFKELESIDYSDKTIIIQLALAALKENEEEFFELLPRAINSEELTVEYLFDFPILQEMRESDKFIEFQNENLKVKEYLTNNAQQTLE